MSGDGKAEVSSPVVDKVSVADWRGYRVRSAKNPGA
jgi:hypothetical protein